MPIESHNVHDKGSLFVLYRNNANSTIKAKLYILLMWPAPELEQGFLGCTKSYYIPLPYTFKLDFFYRPFQYLVTFSQTQ